MPTSGKTTIGKILSEELGREFIDSDEEIVEKIGMSISEFFEKNGEAEFRKIEAQVIKEIALKQGAVIATGGGVILNKRNIELLKMNGKVIFLNRPLDMLLTSEDRPLSSDRELLKKRFEERHEIYKASADVEIIADSDIKTNVQKVKEGF
jgi:shikimate kinase